MIESMDYLKLNQIKPDPNQPRKYFDAEKLRSLTDSIKREGIIQPLVVEKVGTNYLLLDGERRYRAATILKLDKVPVVVESPKNETERLVRQFTVQEQHEGWTPVEKAMALLKLSESLGLTLGETCQLLNVSRNVIHHYIAFANLADKEAWVRSEIPLSYVSYMGTLSNVVKKVSEDKLETEFTKQDTKRLERRIIDGIVDGTITRRTELRRLADSFIKEPKLIAKFMGNKSMTPTAAYLESKAEGVVALRNALAYSRSLTTFGKAFLAHPDAELNDMQRKVLKDAKDVINQILNLVE